MRTGGGRREARGEGVARAALYGLAALLLGASSFVLGVCGPFTDVADAAFCPYVLEIFTLGITTGTTPTTYDPASPVNRLQMAAFLSRTADSLVQRGSRRAALRQFWRPSGSFWTVAGTTRVGSLPKLVACDGADVWVANWGSDSVSRVRVSDGRLLETWTGATGAFGVIVAMGRVVVTGSPSVYPGPGYLYMIDPREPPGSVTAVADNLGGGPHGIAFDGVRVWTANVYDSSISIVTPAATIPWTVTTVTAGFDKPFGVLFDGASVWATDGLNLLRRLDVSGAILQTVTVSDGASAGFPAFDGNNIWVPIAAGQPGALAVVRASSGAVLATLTGNGLNAATAAAFDGQRILVTSSFDRVSLWKAADLTPLGWYPTGAATSPLGACSDGVNLWVALTYSDALLRF